MVRKLKINNHLVEVGSFWAPTLTDEIEIFTFTIDGTEYADECGYGIEDINEVMGILFPSLNKNSVEYEIKTDYILSLI